MPEDDWTKPDNRPIDTVVLERSARRLDGSARFSETVSRPEYAPNSVIAEYDTGYVPAGVTRAYLRLRWFETNDFCVHYSEQYRDGALWECRWDRHPSEHNTRSHFHPPPGAETPGDDAAFADDWRDVLARVLRRFDERVAAFRE